MKVEMLEKIGEIEIVNLRPASENRAIAEVEKAKRAEEERIRKEKEEEQLRKDAQIVLIKIIDLINKEAEKGSNSMSIDFYHTSAKDKYGFTFKEYQKTFELIKPVLESAGYKLDEPYEYSRSWQNKSGKDGHCYIYWYE